MCEIYHTCCKHLFFSIEIVHTCHVACRLIQSEPQNENRHSGVLNTRFNGNGNDIFRWSFQQFSNGETEGKAKPGQSHPTKKHLPSHHLEDVQVGVDAKKDDEKDEAQGHRLQDLD